MQLISEFFDDKYLHVDGICAVSLYGIAAVININIKFLCKITEFQWTFPALTGILSLAYFIHNAVISIVRNQRNPENNVSTDFPLESRRETYFRPHHMHCIDMAC